MYVGYVCIVCSVCMYVACYLDVYVMSVCICVKCTRMYVCYDIPSLSVQMCMYDACAC